MTEPEPSPRVALLADDPDQWAQLAPAAEMLDRFGVAWERAVLPPTLPAELAARRVLDLEARGTVVFVVAAGAVSELAPTVARTATGPVLAVPLESPTFRGLDALARATSAADGLAIGSLAIGRAGAVNAALLAVAILGLADPRLAAELVAFRAEQTARVGESPLA